MKKQSPAKSTKKTAKRTMSWFAIICGVAAAIYLIYRIGLLILPAINISETFIHPKTNEKVVCGHEDDAITTTSKAALSTQYQSRIEQQQPLGNNLVINPGLTEKNSETGQPTGYTHTTDNQTDVYEYLQEQGTPQPFLRATDKGTPTGELVPSWLMQPVTVSPDRTYAYSFWYRSTVPVQLTTQTSKHKEIDTSPVYKDIATLKPTNTWQRFTAHFDNTEQASSFRMTVRMTAPGTVDTRSFEIHEIPSAQLQKGIISVTFDDGWASVDTAAKKLIEKYNIRTTQYIVSEVAEKNVAGYMDIGEITKFKQNGSEIGSHSLTHCDQTRLDTAGIEDNARRSKQILEQQKLGPITTFAYPFGQYNEATQAIYSKEYALIRTSDAGYNDRYFDTTNIHSMGILDTTTQDELQSWIDHAKANKLWLVLVYHRVDESGEYNVSASQLEQQLAAIAGSGLDILPVTEAANATRR